MPKQVKGTRIPLGLAEDQVIAGPAVLLPLECPAALPRPWRWPSARTLHLPGVEHVAPGGDQNDQVDQGGQSDQPERPPGFALAVPSPENSRRCVSWPVRQQ